MKREFSCRVYLNRSEMNAAQYQLGKVGVKTLPQLFRFALEKIDVNLADQVLDYETRIANLNRVNTSLREKIKTADNTVELHKRDSEKWERLFDEKFELYSGGMRVFQERAEEAEKLLREKIEAYEQEVAVVVALRLEFEEIKTERDKYRPAYDFLCHELGLRNNEVYDEKHFTSEFEKLFAILEDEQDAHLRIGLRLENIFARYNYARRTQNEYFQLLCKGLALDSSKLYSLNDFDVAFGRLLCLDEDNSSEMPPETVSFWERIKRLFRRKS